MTDVPTVIEALGALTGAVSISLAVFFQLISPRSCPFRYVAAFFIYGIIILLFFSTVFYFPAPVESALALVGIILSFGAEFFAAKYVYDRIPTHGVFHPTAEWLSDDDRLS